MLDDNYAINLLRNYDLICHIWCKIDRLKASIFCWKSQNVCYKKKIWLTNYILLIIVNTFYDKRDFNFVIILVELIFQSIFFTHTLYFFSSIILFFFVDHILFSDFVDADAPYIYFFARSYFFFPDFVDDDDLNLDS